MLKIIDEVIPKDSHILEGESFGMAPKIPAYPQRGANTVGLVIEYPKTEGVKDKLQ